MFWTQKIDSVSGFEGETNSTHQRERPKTGKRIQSDLSTVGPERERTGYQCQDRDRKRRIAHLRSFLPSSLSDSDVSPVSLLDDLAGERGLLTFLGLIEVCANELMTPNEI